MRSSSVMHRFRTSKRSVYPLILSQTIHSTLRCVSFVVASSIYAHSFSHNLFLCVYRCWILKERRRQHKTTFSTNLSRSLARSRNSKQLPSYQRSIWTLRQSLRRYSRVALPPAVETTFRRCWRPDQKALAAGQAAQWRVFLAL